MFNNIHNGDRVCVCVCVVGSGWGGGVRRRCDLPISSSSLSSSSLDTLRHRGDCSTTHITVKVCIGGWRVGEAVGGGGGGGEAVEIREL